MELKGRRIAILAEDLYQDLELWYLALRLREAGADVTIVGTGKSVYTSKHGYPVKADKSADKVKTDDFDAVVVPGGYAPDLMRRHEPMVRLVREMGKARKVVAAICHGGWMLASANLLRGRKATGFIAIRDDMVNAGAMYEDSEVVRDGTLITSRKPEDLPAFCRTIVQAVSEGRGRSRHPGSPAASGHPWPPRHSSVRGRRGTWPSVAGARSKKTA